MESYRGKKEFSDTSQASPCFFRTSYFITDPAVCQAFARNGTQYFLNFLKFLIFSENPLIYFRNML